MNYKVSFFVVLALLAISAAVFFGKKEFDQQYDKFVAEQRQMGYMQAVYDVITAAQTTELVPVTLGNSSAYCMSAKTLELVNARLNS